MTDKDTIIIPCILFILGLATLSIGLIILRRQINDQKDIASVSFQLLDSRIDRIDKKVIEQSQQILHLWKSMIVLRDDFEAMKTAMRVIIKTPPGEKIDESEIPPAGFQ